MWRVTADPQRFDEAIAWFRQRVPLERGEWDQLTEQARRQAFTVSGVAELDVIADVHQALLRAVEEGTSYDEFKKVVGEELANAWGRPQSARVKTIWQTNIQQAYSAGRYQQMTEPEVAASRPYFMYDAVLDNRTSDICRSLNGTVLPQDDPFWDTHTPPLHFGCRSGLRSLTKRAAEARGITQRLPDAPPQAGFGARPEPGEWGREWAKSSVRQLERVGRLREAFIGDPPTYRDYGRPTDVERIQLPTALLPTASEVGESRFLELVRQSWGGEKIEILDPTKSGVILSEELLGRVLGRQDQRERYLSLLPHLIRDPYEIWLVPLQLPSGTIVFQKEYIAVYQDPRDKDYALLFIAEQYRGAWSGFNAYRKRDVKQLSLSRRGFLRYGK